ncbi:hypothetical protein [Pseudoalteromonas prydzensis]|uniref:hypothetical protein n=1 Tax=Pseudoalteromonas prydzensis TaxID=182141 RepID=UPI003FD2F692
MAECNKQSIKNKELVMPILDIDTLPQMLAPYIERGETLKYAAQSLGVKYVTMKNLSRKACISYPSSEELRNNYCIHTYGLNFREYVLKLKSENFSNRYIARQLNIQPCTLYLLADKHGLDIKGKPYKLDVVSSANINAAKERRFSTSKTAHLLTYEGETKTLNEWARKVGIDRTALRKRIVDLKWPISEAMMVPSGQKIRQPKLVDNSLKAKHKKHRTTDKPSIIRTQLLQLAKQYHDNCYDVERNTWYMIRVVSTGEPLHYEHAEELESGSLYIGRNGEPCSLDRAAIVNSSALALTYIQCMPLWNGRKLRNALLTAEQFKCEFEQVQDSICSSDWLGQVQSLMNKHKVWIHIE